MIRRRAGIAIGNPPGYIGHEDDIYKVLGISGQKETSGALLYECACKLCDGTHLRNAKHLKQKIKAKDCPKYRAPNWSGLEKEDRIMQSMYGISLEEFKKLLEYQQGKCAICEKDISFNRSRINVDHCHETDKVRGLLCSGCNTGLGHLGDNLAGLQRAVTYLENPPFSLARAR
jgi:hypothetical protein